jgi:chemotaxis signal transduction protein
VEVEEGELVGVLVDEVRRVERLAADDVEAPGASLGGDVAAHVTGIARPRGAGGARDEAIVIVDLAALVGAALRRGGP